MKKPDKIDCPKYSGSYEPEKVKDCEPKKLSHVEPNYHHKKDINHAL